MITNLKNDYEPKKPNQKKKNQRFSNSRRSTPYAALPFSPPRINFAPRFPQPAHPQQIPQVKFKNKKPRIRPIAADH